MGIDHAIRLLGSEAALAAAIGVSTQAVNHWKLRRRPISAKNCVAIERVTGGQVARGDLRPDLFGALDTARAVADC